MAVKRPMLDVNERIKEVIYKDSRSVRQIARDMRIEPTNVFRWMYNGVLPTLPVLVRFCAVMNVSADYLLFGKGNE